ncbi:MAG: hypothetical protein PHP01_09275 [Phycisphaerae bacterium]|nr:hypothetical protein [Phycisphaerae bacterium]
MGRTKGSLIELIMDKAVLAIAAIAALWLLFSFVISSPAIEYAGQKLTPGQIDEAVNKKALILQEKLRTEPADSNAYQPKKPAYLTLIKDSIIDVKTDIIFPKAPYSTGTIVNAKRVYRLPEIESITKPVLVSVRMAAFVPTDEIGGNLSYENADTKLRDVDLVTVESSIDAKKLYDSFRESFAGKSLPEEWRSEQYAKPVFAVVQMQRRTEQPDGSWSQWITVPRTKICPFKEALELPKKADEYEIQISMVQLAKTDKMKEILQPSVYDNAIPAEPWLSPSLYNERAKRLEKELAESKKLKLEDERASKLSERALRTPARSSAPTRSTLPGAGTPMSGRDLPAAAPRLTRTQSQRPSVTPRLPTDRANVLDQTEPATSELQLFRDLTLTENSKPGQMEKLVFWAHDETTKPGEKYQYRLRIGVFNPVAGTNWLSDEQKNMQNETVLYSNFTEPTEIVEIPQRLRFFATDIREVEKGYTVDRTVEVKVARYTLGNWVTKTFNLKNGEQIGTVVDVAETRLANVSIDIDTIDFSTGAVMVDARRATEWIGTGALRPRDFYELMYCQNDNTIETMPIRERFWPDEVARSYKEITQAETDEPVMLLTRDQAKSGTNVSSQSPDRTTYRGTEIPSSSPGRTRY